MRINQHQDIYLYFQTISNVLLFKQTVLPVFGLLKIITSHLEVMNVILFLLYQSPQMQLSASWLSAPSEPKQYHQQNQERRFKKTHPETKCHSTCMHLYKTNAAVAIFFPYSVGPLPDSRAPPGDSRAPP